MAPGLDSFANVMGFLPEGKALFTEGPRKKAKVFLVETRFRPLSRGSITPIIGGSILPVSDTGISLGRIWTIHGSQWLGSNMKHRAKKSP